MNLDFLKIFDNPLSKYLTKGFLEYIGHKFGNILKLNTVLGLLCLNSKKLSLYNALSIDQVSISDLLYFSIY